MDFVYNVGTSPTKYSNYSNFYFDGSWYCSNVNVGNREGGNGLDFVSAHDPRLVMDTTVAPTCDQSQEHPGAKPWYYPVKVGNPSTKLTIASGVEARLIEAEAALRNGDPSWLARLNALRTTCTDATTCPVEAPAGSGGVAGLAPLTDPVDPDARVDLLFRERAFWLFSTGTRLGDLRRLIRQYDRSANTVFPTGQYAGGVIASLPVYMNDVSLTLPTPASGTAIANPHYKGCLTSPSDG
jgi:hypothetical protein